MTNLENIQYMLKYRTQFRRVMGRSRYNRLLKLLIQAERQKSKNKL